MTNLETTYGNALAELERISQEIQEDLGFEIDLQNIEKSESSLDVADYCFAFLFGFVGAFISTNEELERYLAEIHSAASEANGEYDKFQILMGKLLHHKSDAMDKMIKRDGTPTYIGFHRLLWGHDALRFGEDNPFCLMVQQEGDVLSGILQAFRHLIADTMSKQGLPSPGLSVLDYVDENGKISNYIIDLANNLSIDAFDNKAMSNDLFTSFYN